MLLLAADAGEAAGLLCTLLLIVAVIATALCILALLGIGFGPFRRNTIAGPVIAAVVAWVLYVLLC